MTADIAVSAALACHVLAVEVLAGLRLFLHLMVRPLAPPELDAPLRAWSRRASLAALGVAALSMLAWLALTALSVFDEASAEGVWAVLHGTWFGTVWAGRAALTAFLGFILLRERRGTELGSIGLAPALLLLLTLSLVSHPAAGHSLAHVMIHMLHLATTAAWVGSLPVLAYLLRWPELARPVVGAYGRFGAIAVLMIIASGAAMAWVMTDGTPSLSTEYGAILGVKLLLAGLMLAIGASNRFILTPRIRQAAPGAIEALRISVIIELGVATLVIAAASILAQTIPPAGH